MLFCHRASACGEPSKNQWLTRKIPKPWASTCFASALSDNCTKKEAAKLIGVDEFTYLNWEKDRRAPLIRHWPALIDFLGGDPNPEPRTLGERMKAKRRQMGWTTRMAAAAAGVDEGTWRYAETSSTARTARVRSGIEACVGCTS